MDLVWLVDIVDEGLVFDFCLNPIKASTIDILSSICFFSSLRLATRAAAISLRVTVSVAKSGQIARHRKRFS